MKGEVIVAIIAGIVALYSAVMSSATQLKVTGLQRAQANELELVRSQLSQDLEERKFSFEERRDGYRAFFKGSSKYWKSIGLKEQAEEIKTKEESTAKELQEQAIKLFQDYIDLEDMARFKIGVFSDAPVVQAYAEYLRFRLSEKINCRNPEKFKKDVAIYQAMRVEMKAKGNVQNNDLIMVLFDCIQEG